MVSSQTSWADVFWLIKTLLSPVGPPALLGAAHALVIISTAFLLFWGDVSPCAVIRLVGLLNGFPEALLGLPLPRPRRWMVLLTDRTFFCPRCSYSSLYSKGLLPMLLQLAAACAGLLNAVKVSAKSERN